MASPINDDYPVLMLEDFNALGSEDSIYLHYKHNVDDLIDAYSYTNIDHVKHPTPSIYLYDTVANGLTDGKPTPVPIEKTNIVKIGGKDVMFPMLAINEDVGILQNVELMARTGVTIRNARKGMDDFTDNPNWHLFSSSIDGVPMGIRYRTVEDGTSMYVREVGVDMSGNSVTFEKTGTYDAVIVEGGYENPVSDPNGEEQPYHLESVWSKRKHFDPPKTEWYQSDDEGSEATYFPERVGYFPTDTPYGTWRPGTSEGHVASAADGFFDLYAYSEEFYHWVNFKREGTPAGADAIRDHWHMDGDEHGNHWRLNYGYRDESGAFTLGNEPTLLNGKGYMLDLSSESMLMADGRLNAGDLYTWVTKTPLGKYSPTGDGYDAPWRNINLIGNPYHSFLDFKIFAEENGGGSQVEYATRDDHSAASRNGYVYYVYGQSQNHDEYTASRYIHPHQGFFVKASGNGTLKFTEAMRFSGTSTSPDINSPYRSQVNYPLVNLLCHDDEGVCDLTIVEVNRPEFGGGEKMKKLHTGKGMIYARLEERDFHVLFTPVGTNEVPVRFVPNEDGVFTLSWNTLHGEFGYLHLIDNIAGVDVDCLTADEYKFEGKTSDYKSRFKLVFRCDGDEPEDPEEPDDGEDGEHFAFMFGDELVVNGEGMLQMFDIRGRCLMETRAVGQQSSHRLPSVAAGVYVFRLTGAKKVKVQKMVIK